MPGVYISWPFCSQKCTYCNFASGVFAPGLQARYLERLLEEIRGHQWGWTPQTVYLGGGTPGSMPAEALRRILEMVPGKPWKEASLEAAPGAVDADAVREWLRRGLNRVSLGVQSFVDEELRRTGRRHTAEGVERDVALLRGAGLANINVDLIAGLPAQSEAGWRASLEWIGRLDPPHVSVYMLEVDEDSRLGRELLAGGARFGAGAVPPEEKIADFYEMAVEFLEGRGWRRYEISNFAKPGFESLHNLKYWRMEPYAGFGADAHSFDGDWRTANTDDVRGYAGSGPQAQRVGADRQSERYLTGLRLMEGVDLMPEDEARFGAAVERFVREGLMERSGARVRLTRRGVMLSNEVFEAFL